VPPLPSDFGYFRAHLHQQNFVPQTGTTLARLSLADAVMESGAITCRCRHGIWSNEYVERLIAQRRVKTADATIVKGVFAPVAIYCTKLIPNFRSLLNNKPHYMHCTEYVGGQWNRLVGEAMYAADEDYDSDNTVLCHYFLGGQNFHPFPELPKTLSLRLFSGQWNCISMLNHKGIYTTLDE
jgi:hypothetical protein